MVVPDRVDGDLRDDVALDLGDIHVRGVLEVGGEAVVLADEGIEDIGEVDVGVLITGIDTAVLWKGLGHCFNRLECSYSGVCTIKPYEVI